MDVIATNQHKLREQHLDTNHGITALGRAGADNNNWPMVRKGAWTVLEAKTKGFSQ